MRNRRYIGLALLCGFLLGAYNGYIALWEEKNPDPVKVFPYHVSSLPAADQKALEKGISIGSKLDLNHLLEDYLS